MLVAVLIIAAPTVGAQQPPPSGTVLLADDFDDAVNGRLPVVSDDPQRANRAYIDGEYLIRKSDPGMELSPISTLPGTYSDAVLAVDARLVGPADGRTVSIACRSDEESDSQYRLTLQPGIGQFELIRWDNGQRVALQDWQPSSAIRPGNDVNRLELNCAGPTITAGINGIQVAAVQDPTYTRGLLWIGTGDLQSLALTVEARFDNLVVTQP